MRCGAASGLLGEGYVKKWVVYRFDPATQEVGLSHGTIDLKNTLCGLICTPGWITGFGWGDGPECKRCKKIARDTIAKIEAWQ